MACWLALPLPRRQMPFARAMLGLPRWARAARRDGKTWSHAVQIWRAYMGQARLGNMGLRNNAACTVQPPGQCRDGLPDGAPCRYGCMDAVLWMYVHQHRGTATVLQAAGTPACVDSAAAWPKGPPVCRQERHRRWGSPHSRARIGVCVRRDRALAKPTTAGIALIKEEPVAISPAFVRYTCIPQPLTSM